jgi:hypothetical protein
MFAADMAKVKATVNSTAIQMQRAFLGVQQRANVAATSIMRMGSVAGIAAAVGLAAFIKKSVDAAGEIDDAAQRIGISAEKFQELAYAAKLAGVEQKDFATAMEQFTRRLGEVNVKGTAAEKTLSKLGIGLEDIKGKSPDKVLDLFAERLKRVEDPMQRNAILAELFGRAGIKMAIMLKDGAAGMAGLAKEARALGFVVSSETIEKAAKAGDEIDRMALAMRAAGINMSAGFLPALESLRRVMTSQGFQDGIKTISQEMGKFIKFLVENKDEIIAVTTAFVVFQKVTAATKNPLVGLAAGVGAGIAAGEAFRSEIEKTERELDRLESSAKRMRETLVMGQQAHGKQGAGMWGVQDKLIATQKQIDETKVKLDELKKKAAEQAEPTEPTKAATKIDITSLADQEAAKTLLEELTFKTRLAKGEFKEFAEGFPEAARGIGLFGTELRPAVTTVAELPGHLQRVNDQMKKLNDAKKVAEMMKGVADAIGKAFEDAIVEGKSLSEVLQALYKDLLRLLIRKMFTEPFGNFLTAAIPKMANGGPVRAGTMYEVGERGREMFVPRVDGRIVSNQELKSLPSGGDGLTYAPVINMPGADVAAVARMERVLHQHSRDLAAQKKAMSSAQHHQASGVYR